MRFRNLYSVAAALLLVPALASCSSDTLRSFNDDSDDAGKTNTGTSAPKDDAGETNTGTSKPRDDASMSAITPDASMPATTPDASTLATTPDASSGQCGDGVVDKGEECDGEDDCTKDCKLKDIACTDDAMECPDGSFVSRDPKNNCEFEACPTMACSKELKVCADGSSVGRDPKLNCEFPACPVAKCCDPKTKPQGCFEGVGCCPNGDWACGSIGDGKTFICDGKATVSQGPVCDGETKCTKDADCRLFDFMCTGCNCLALHVDEKDLKCTSPTPIQCLFPPCQTKSKAACNLETGECVALENKQ